MELDIKRPLPAGGTASSSSGSGEQPVEWETNDRIAEKKLLRKCDLHVIPVITVLYLLAFIDRINIGNARIQGLEDDLGMKGSDFNIALFVFFIPYILFEVPSNLIIREISPATWLSSIMVCWGIVTVCQGVTQSYAGFVVCRFLLGLFEAGFFPGCTYLIAMYYKPHEMQWRFSIFFSASILSGSFSGVVSPFLFAIAPFLGIDAYVSGFYLYLPKTRNADSDIYQSLLAYALASMEGVGGYNGWRWIFIIEGLLTVLCAAASKFLMADWPETSKFLTGEERKLLTHRLRQDVTEGSMNKLDKAARRRIFTDWKIYVGIVMYFGVVNTGYATSFFTPTILKQLGWTNVHAQIMTIPIYVVACVLALITAFLSDHLRHRYTFAMAGLVIAAVGYILLLCQLNVPVSVRYFSLFLVTSGGYITQPVTIVWLMNNLGGHRKRSVGAAMQIGLGNCGGIVASNIFLTGEMPTYPLGFGTSLGLLGLCGVACTGFVLGLRTENKKRDNGERDERLALPEKDLQNLGDGHPRFRFVY